MTAAEIRQSFFDFFREKRHTIVPSASLLPQSPGLLFTNAGMNPFVPYFLGTEKAPFDPPRAADTQKCIRAGGKHNDLEDVGYDTYHHTFFEMLGNWSFGDYFKKEAIAWAWELVVTRWGLPPQRLYATVYAPQEGDPGSFDQESWDLWAELFTAAGCDPAVQIVNGSVKDNFWMMGETGPCGPCSELHVDLSPLGDSAGKLVNQDSDLCIEIWNLVFIQFNAEADGSFRELPSKHVDTGMGFERACSIIQNTRGFTDFSRKPSNYATDVFTPLFAKISALSGKSYTDIYPAPGADRSVFGEEMKTAIAFRVIADHLRTLVFSIADGILPGNNGRNYVLRRILRRAVRYGRQLGFGGDAPFLGALLDTLVDQMAATFPELRNRRESILATLENEEASFNQTLDRGLRRFEAAVAERAGLETGAPLSGDVAFELYDTFGFPLDLTELLTSERGMAVDTKRFEELMERQRAKSQAAQSSTLVRALDFSSEVATEFLGFDADETSAEVLEVHRQGEQLFVITDRTVFYAEMGGQAGDRGTLVDDGVEMEISGVAQVGRARAHVIDAGVTLEPGDRVTLRLDSARRRPIEAHHSATHLLHWALHEVISKDVVQQGSAVDEHRLRFDFNSAPVTREQLVEMELLVNRAINANDPVSWTEVAHETIRQRADIMQFFGDKYGEKVRVVQIGGVAQRLDGYSMELCGGTHVRNTGAIGLFKIRSEGAVAAGVRRIEALCGDAAWNYMHEEVEAWNRDLDAARAKLAAANEALVELGGEAVVATDFPHIMSAMLAERGDFEDISATFEHGRRTLAEIRQAAIDAEKRLRKIQVGRAASQADAALVERIAAGGPIIASFESDAALLQELQNGLKKKNFGGVAFLLVDDGEKLHLAIHCGAEALARGLKAGDLLRQLAELAGGKGGGKPDQARGAAPDRARRAELESAAAKLFQ